MEHQIEMPAAHDAEAAVLRCLIENPRRFKSRAWEANFILDVFDKPAHQALWHIISIRLRDDRPIDPTSLRDAIKGRKTADLSVSDISDILLTESDEDSWDGYVETIRDRYARRVSIQAGLAVASENDDGQAALDRLRRAVDAATSALSGSTYVMDAKTSTEAFLASLQERYENGHLPGLPTGIDALDTRTGGMRRGELWVIGGKPSMGKSVMMLQIAGHALLNLNKKVAIFSLEMGADEVIGRIVSCSRHLPIGQILNPRTCGAAGVTKIREGAMELQKSGLMICDNPDASVEIIAAHCQRIADTVGLDLIVVDYIQQVPSVKVKGQNREQEVAVISSSLKRLAKRLKVPVLTATQLNEQGQARESKAIEQDADNVFLIQAKDTEWQTLQLWKVRNGKRGDELLVQLNGEFQKFRFS